MKIAVTADGPTLDSKVDSRFGRCLYFIVVDPETLEFEALENSSSVAGGGAGISASQIIAGKKVDAVLTGNCGPNAYQALSAAGIKVVTEVSGKVREAIKGYKLGKLNVSAQPNVAAHYGVGASRR